MESLNAWFNRFVDVSLVVATRLAELPFAFVALVAVLGVSLVFAFQRLAGRPGRSREPLRRRYVRAVAVTVAVATLVHLMQRTDLILRESRELQFFARKGAVTLSSVDREAQPTLDLIQEVAAQRELQALLGPIDFSAVPLARGVELAQFHSLGSKPVAGWVSVTDLRQPALEIEISAQLSKKSLTSEFGRERGCVVAINGEAGISPARDAPLDSYVGTCIERGARIHGPNQERPSLTFDRSNRAEYHAVGEQEGAPPPSTFNAIWGRGDLLIDGERAPEHRSRWERANPRTLMGVDETGTLLVLAVIDGRQQGHSLGADIETASGIMEAFGVSDAMWCDQGGSSAMYLGCLRGLVNRPSDGRERPTYSHFGVSVSEPD